MPLSLTSPIFATEIQEIKELGDHGNVWLLKGHNDDKVVIKHEGREADVFKSANPAIKAIAPQAALKILKPEELQALNRYIAGFAASEMDYQILGMPLSASEKKAIKSLKYRLGLAQKNGWPFVKMAAVNVMDLGGALEKRMAGDKSDLQAFTNTLNAPGGLERLGKILAADLFVTNFDRFCPKEYLHGRQTNMNLGGVTLYLRCLLNIGNVFQIDTGSGVEVGAMDFIWPKEGFENINTPLADAERVGGEWMGRLLADRRRREEYAKDVVHDLEAVLSPRKHVLSMKSKLNPDAARRVANGMVEGAKLIKASLESKHGWRFKGGEVAPSKWTPGIEDRYKVMCQVL